MEDDGQKLLTSSAFGGFWFWRPASKPSIRARRGGLPLRPHWTTTCRAKTDKVDPVDRTFRHSITSWRGKVCFSSLACSD